MVLVITNRSGWLLELLTELISITAHLLFLFSTEMKQVKKPTRGKIFLATLVVSLILYHFGTKQGGGVVKNALFNETHDTISKDFTFYLLLIVHTSIDPSE